MQHRLGRRDENDRVGLDERARGTQRDALQPAELDERWILGVVHDAPRRGSPARSCGEYERLELPAPGPAGEARRDEDRLLRVGDAEAPQLVTVAAIASRRGSTGAPGSGSDGGSTTIVTRPPRGTSPSSGGPASGKRRASRTPPRRPRSTARAPGE